MFVRVGAFLHRSAVYACTRASSLLYGQTVRVVATDNAGIAISDSVAEGKEELIKQS